MKSELIWPDIGPKQILSGALHYFRVHPGLWQDRLEKAVAMGLNTIETYVPWNLHEPHPGEFVFTGLCDVESFIRKAAELGLYVIVRPGPYICAEWDNGGLPAWLNSNPELRVRCMNRPYLDAVARFFHVLLPKLTPLQTTHGGPILMFQVENEYGSFGGDHEYMQWLLDLYRKEGIDTPCFTSDGPYGLCPVGGSIPGAYLTGNFGMNHEKAFASLRKLRPDEPDFCMEFWDGWFDHWGEKHQHRPAADGGEAFDSEYEAIVRRGANVNLYMFHGGTNFGFTAGANGDTPSAYAPIVTSYDYDAPLTECGDPGEKFLLCQTILKKYTGNPKIRTVEPAGKIVPADVTLTEECPLPEHWSRFAVKHGEGTVPLTMEQLEENFGFVHYRTELDPFDEPTKLRFSGVSDYAQIWINGKYLGSRYRDRDKEPLTLGPLPEGGVLDILVESMGHVNYGPYLGCDPKGLWGPVCRNSIQLFHWEYEAVPLSSVSDIPFLPLKTIEGKATFYRGCFELNETGEAFLKRPGAKGYVWVNGFPLGRYWDRGPTETLYVPSAALRQGKNEIIVFEQEGLLSADLKFSPVHLPGELA